MDVYNIQHALLNDAIDAVRANDREPRLRADVTNIGNICLAALNQIKNIYDAAVNWPGLDEANRVLARERSAEFDGIIRNVQADVNNFGTP